MATFLIWLAATFYRIKWTKSMKISLNKVASDRTGTIVDDKVAESEIYYIIANLAVCHERM